MACLIIKKIISAIVLVTAAYTVNAQAYSGQYFSGEGDESYLHLLDISRRMWAPDPIYQSVPMLYRFGDDQ
jgi:hypothetical protein